MSPHIMGRHLYFVFFALTVSVIGATSTLPRPQLPLRHAVSSKPYFDGAFDDYVKEVLEYWKVPGLSIAVVDGDDVYSKVHCSRAGRLVALARKSLRSSLPSLVPLAERVDRVMDLRLYRTKKPHQTRVTSLAVLPKPLLLPLLRS